MNKIYSTEQLKEFLSTLAIGSEAAEKITEFAQLQQNRFDFQQKRVNTAAQLLGHDLINECLDDE